MKKLIIGLLFFSFSLLITSTSYNAQLSFYLLLPSFLILLVASLPLLINNETNFFSPLPYLVYWIFLTVFMRMIYIVYDYPDKSFIQTIFLQNNEKLYLVKPLIIILISMISFIVGYLIKPSDRKIITTITFQYWNKTKIYMSGILLSVISFFALSKFVSQNIGGILFLAASNISSYRGVSENMVDYSASGLLRILVMLAEIGFIILFSYNILAPKKDKLIYVLALFNFLIAFFFYFFTQSRSGLLFLIINPFVLNYLLKEQKLKIGKTVITLLASIILFSFITSFRTGVGLESASFSIKGIQRLFDPLIANNGGFDVSKTGLIIDYIDNNEQKQVGKSFLWIITSFIPRSIWPDKPVNIDTYFGMKVYGATTYGTGAVPPGLFAELYWNFGYLGIFFGCFAFGLVLRWFSNRFLIYGSKNINSLIIYVVCFMSLGVSIFGSSITSAIIGIIYKLIPLAMILRYITEQKKIDYIQ